MHSIRAAAAAAVISIVLPQAVSAEKPTVTVFTNATFYSGVGDAPITKGALVIADGKIAALLQFPESSGSGVLTLGVREAVKQDVQWKLIDLKGAVVIPGLVDTHSHIGVYPKPSVPAHSDGNEMSGPVQPGVRAADGVWPDDPGVRMAAAGGVTTANIMPGSGNAIGGQTVYVKLRGQTVEDMRVTGKLADGTEVLGGLKMANGENPKGYGRNRQQAPFTRMKVAALQREQFVKAKEYAAKRKAWQDGDKKGPEPERDLALEPLVEVLEKKRTVHFHCHRADDLVTALRIAEEFGFEIVLQHATEGYRVADLLAKKKVPVSLTLIDSPGGKAETVGLLEENAAVLDKAGVPVAINTDDSVTESRFYLRTGAIAVRGGMSDAAALRALTITPAKMMHLDHRIGSLEAGKDADFVVLSGPPFSVYTKVLETWIDGKKAFDAADEAQRPYRDGGFALPRGAEVPKADAAVPPKRVAVPAPQPETREAPVPGLLYIRAGRVHTAAGEPIDDAAIIVEGGRIKSVGAAAEVKRPFGATTIRAAEVTPGLIDPFTVAGLSGTWNIPADQDQDEPSDPNQADLRVLDGFNPNEPLLEFLRSNGITVAHVTSGRVNVLGGTSGVFRLTGTTAEQAALKPAFAVLVNLGEVPKASGKDKGPQTRMGVAGLVRKAFAEAQAYREKKKNPPSPPTAVGGLSPKLEALLPALEKKSPVIFAAHRADDIRTALRLADEFGLDPVIALGTEAYQIADELAKRKVPVIVHPTMQRAGGSMETLNAVLANAAVLKGKGVPVTIGTGFEGYVPKTRNLRAEAAMAAANGLGPAGALRAVTLDAAKLLGIDKDYGSIEAGKAADLVLYDGDPFEHATHVTHTLVGGKTVYDRAEYLALPFDRRVLPLLGASGGGVGCCLGW